jgi:hypothetical protein
MVRGFSEKEARIDGDDKPARWEMGDGRWEMEDDAL